MFDHQWCTSLISFNSIHVVHGNSHLDLPSRSLLCSPPGLVLHSFWNPPTSAAPVRSFPFKPNRDPFKPPFQRPWIPFNPPRRPCSSTRTKGLDWRPPRSRMRLSNLSISRGQVHEAASLPLHRPARLRRHHVLRVLRNVLERAFGTPLKVGKDKADFVARHAHLRHVPKGSCDAPFASSSGACLRRRRTDEAFCHGAARHAPAREAGRKHGRDHGRTGASWLRQGRKRWSGVRRSDCSWSRCKRCWSRRQSHLCQVLLHRSAVRRRTCLLRRRQEHPCHSRVM